MSDKPTYEELELRCQRLANIIIRNNHATEELIRAEVKKAKAKAWDEGAQSWYASTKPDNPYKEQS